MAKMKVRYDVNKATGTTAAFDVTKPSKPILICAFPGRTGQRKCEAYVGLYMEGATQATIDAGMKARIGGYAMEALKFFTDGLLPQSGGK